jgi:hypothetical protein
MGYDVRVEDVLVPTAVVLVPLVFLPLPLLVRLVWLLVRRARWHRRPDVLHVRVHGVIGLFDGRLTCRLGLLGHDVCVVDVYVVTVVVLAARRGCEAFAAGRLVRGSSARSLRRSSLLTNSPGCLLTLSTPRPSSLDSYLAFVSPFALYDASCFLVRRRFVFSTRFPLVTT